MQLILDKQKTAGRRKSRLQERFDKLCSTLERQRRRSARFRQDIDDLVEVYHRRSLENDKEVFGDLVALSEKLIAFAGRKSLSEWHRIELDEWLKDLIERRITPLDRELAGRLHLEYRQAIARSMGISVDELIARFEAASWDVEQEEAEQGGAGKTDPADDGPCQEDLFGFDDNDPQTAGGDGSDDPHGPDWSSEEDEAHIGQTVMDGSWAKSLFRRAAQALHPDREHDPEQRGVKQERMRELLRARKQGDIMAMLSIYSDSVSGADVVLAEHEMNEICRVLEHQLEAVELEKHGYVYAHPVRHMVFELFYHSTKKERERRIREWEHELKQESADLRSLLPSLRNLACLKSVLQDRRDERAAVLVDMMLDDIRF